MIPKISEKSFCPKCKSTKMMLDSWYSKDDHGNWFRAGDCKTCRLLIFRFAEHFSVLGNKNNFIKAVGNATAGLPISFVLNISILPFFATWFITGNVAYSAAGAALVAIPFWCASVFRMFIIDWAYEKYNIKVDPKSVAVKLISKIRH